MDSLPARTSMYSAVCVVDGSWTKSPTDKIPHRDKIPRRCYFCQGGRNPQHVFFTRSTKSLMLYLLRRTKFPTQIFQHPYRNNSGSHEIHSFLTMIFIMSLNSSRFSEKLKQVLALDSAGSAILKLKSSLPLYQLYKPG